MTTAKPEETSLQFPQDTLEALDQNHPGSLEILGDLEESGITIEDKEGVAHSLDVIRQEFGVDNKVFEQPKNKIVLSAIANQLNHIEKEESKASQKRADLEYVADLVMLTVGPHTSFAEQHKKAIEAHDIPDEQARAAYDKFTQPELSREMDAFIKGPEFDELRTRLGISKEQPFEVRVLSIVSGNAEEAYGLMPHVDFGKGKLSVSELQERVDEDEYRKAYAKQLRENGKAFNKALGRNHSFAPAWVTTFAEGEQCLCLASPTAEKVLYKDEERAAYFDEDDMQRDLALVKHEYTHTQKRLKFGDELGLGIALEELRAEHFSGDRHGYTDIKRFFAGMRMLTGYSPKLSFDKEGTSYDEETFLTDIAKNIGLDGLLDALAVIPTNYATDEEANPYVKSVVAHNGGSLNAQFQKIYDRLKLRDGAAVVEARISKFIDSLREQLKDKEFVSVESWLYYGGITSLGEIGSRNFRTRYPNEGDDYDYTKADRAA